MDPSIVERIKRIQRHLNVEPDGLIGATTLTALETQLFPKPEIAAKKAPWSLVVSQKGLKQLVTHEISSAAYYNKFLKHPVWPGGGSGVTIGIGYDLGYNSATQIRKDWSGKISDIDLEKLAVVAGLKGESAKAARRNVRQTTIDLSAAETVFYQVTLPRYAASALNAYPGTEKLFADAQAALLSLVYNRGTKMTGSTRTEMKAIQPLVEQQDYAGIAAQIRAMKRLWVGKGLDGLLKRREDEAVLVDKSHRDYNPGELIHL